MALKSEYGDSRRDATRLTRDVRPGDRLYVIHDVSKSVAPYEDDQLYSTWIVAENRAWASGSPTVYVPGSSDRRGSQTVQQLLCSHRKVYTQPPAGMRDIAVSKQVTTDKQVATYATRVHEADAAEDRRNRRQPVAAGKKSRWW